MTENLSTDGWGKIYLKIEGIPSFQIMYESSFGVKRLAGMQTPGMTVEDAKKYVTACEAVTSCSEKGQEVLEYVHHFFCQAAKWKPTPLRHVEMA